MTKSCLTGNPKISTAQQHVRAADILGLPQRLMVLILFFLERLELRHGETVRCGEAQSIDNLGVTPSRRLTNRCTEAVTRLLSRLAPMLGDLIVGDIYENDYFHISYNDSDAWLCPRSKGNMGQK